MAETCVERTISLSPFTVATLLFLSELSTQKKMRNPIIYQELFPGKWKKVILQRGAGSSTKTDPYVYTPGNEKLRSGVELFNFIVKHPEYWQDFDATKVNVDKCTDGTNLTRQTRKLVTFLDLVNSGKTVEEASP